MAEIQGTCDPRFESVKQAFASNFDQGLDVGASVAVVLDGELVVDLWGGHADRSQDEAVGARHDRQRLVDHQDDDRAVRADARRSGRARPPRPVATYWPEFAANGKENVEVRHLHGPHRGALGLGRAA